MATELLQTLTFAIPEPAAGRGRPPQAAARRAGLEIVEKVLTNSCLLHSMRTARVLPKRRFCAMDKQRPPMAPRDLSAWQSALGASWVQLSLRKDVLGQLLVELSFGDLFLQARRARRITSLAETVNPASCVLAAARRSQWRCSSVR